MSKGAIIERKGKRGVSYLLKYDGPKDPATGRRRQLYATVRGTKKDAQKELRRLLGQIDEGTHVDPSKLTLAQWVETWFATYGAARSAKTVERYRELLRLQVLPRIGNARLQALTGHQLDALYATLREEGRKRASENGPRGLSEQTILHIHRVLNLLLGDATRKRILARNPVADASAPSPRAKATAEGQGRVEVIRALERDQLDALLSAIRSRPIFPLAAIAAGTGMREGEILALRWSDVDFDACTVRIDRALESTKEHGLRFKTPKTAGSRRTIGIDAGLVALLRSQRARQAEDQLKLGRHLAREALVFPQSPLEPAAPLHPDRVSKGFARAAKKAAFTGLRFHDLRHTHATLLLTAGVPLNAVAQRLGHSTPTTTLRVYGHVLKRAEDQAVQVSGALLERVLGADQG